MEHEFMGQGALILLAVVSAAGFFGLRMCREMLRSMTASDLRREAAISMIQRANFYRLSSHQLALVFHDLSESGPRRDASRPRVRSPGFRVV